MAMTWPSSLIRLRPLWKRALIAAALALAMVASLGGSIKPAKAVGTDLLILSTTITKPDVRGNPLSVEEQEATSLGLTYTVVTPAQWATMTTAQFASYKALVLGDPTCGGSDLLTPTANAPVWSAAVNGSVVAIGTDPTFHTNFSPGNGAPSSGPRTVVHNGISFAASDPGRTGLYLTLSCNYNGTPVLTPVPLMNAAFGPGFTVRGVGCYNISHIVATSPALLGLTDAALSNWSCSVHEAFDSIPSTGGWIVLAMAAGIGGTYTAPDGTVGTPYILARGRGLAPGNISLSPSTQDVNVGTTATVTALTQTGGTPLAGQLVTFKVISGPNAGLTGTAITGAGGTATFSYTSATAGKDTLTASFTDPTGHPQTSNTADINWKSSGPPPEGYLQFTLSTSKIDLYDQAGTKLTPTSTTPGPPFPTEHGPVPTVISTYTFSVAGSQSTTITTRCSTDYLNCSIVGIQYGAGSTTTPVQNLLSVQYYKGNEGYTSLNQQVYIGNAIDTAEWNAGPNTTTLKHVQPSPATSQTLPGMVLLQIWTNKGAVQFQHT